MAAADIAAMVRAPAKAEAQRMQGVMLRQGDYDDVASLEAAFGGAQKLLLISAGEPGAVSGSMRTPSVLQRRSAKS